jgi:polar amino acid transport system substrate-binding protein
MSLCHTFLSFHLRFSLAYTLCLLQISLTAHASPTIPLRFCFEDTEQQPWTMPNQTGLNFDLLKRVEALTGEQFVYQALPWKRCIAYVASGEIDGVLGAAQSAERRQFAAFPQDEKGQERSGASLYTDDFLVYLRSDSKVTWDGHQFKNVNGAIAAQAGFVVAGQLQKLGYQVNERSKTAENGLRLVLIKEVDAAVLQGPQALQLQRKDPRFNTSINVLPQPFSRLHLHLMIAKPSYAKDPKRIEAIWQAIEKVRASSAYQTHEKEVLSKLD